MNRPPGRAIVSALPFSCNRQPEDHVAVALAGSAQGGELVEGEPLDPDEVAAALRPLPLIE